MRQVYVLLSRTQTLPSKIVHSVTGGDFTHTSLALSPRSDHFYSFGRRKLNNPLVAGLIVEDVQDGVFKKYPNAHCALYQISVSDMGYKKIQKYLCYLLENYPIAKYNFAGAIPQRIGIRWRRKFRFTCSQFVATALSKSEEIPLPKNPNLMLPNDFLKVTAMEQIYKGPLKDLRF